MTLGVLLLVPLVYLVLTLSALQGASFAAEGAARQAARVFVLAPSDAVGRQRASDAITTGLADWHVKVDAARVTLRCAPDPDHCLTPSGTVTVVVQVAVTLPLLPPALHVAEPGTIRLEATAVERVSTFVGGNQ